MGYNKLIFEDDFTSAPDIGYRETGHKWTSGIWWYQDKTPDKSHFIWDGKDKLTIQVNPGDEMEHCDLCTQYYDHSGGTQFEYGYFEARLWVSDWAAFWLFCWDRPTVHGDKVLPSDPMTWTNELDIIEGDGGYANRAYCSLHKNTSGDGGVADEMNKGGRNWFDTNAPLSKYWHDYGLLWHPNYLTWFIDSVPILTLEPAYPSTNQPTQLILTAGRGGVGGSPSTQEPPQLKIDWVQVWR
jgi:Glycosyl hydrolases family 16